MRSRWIDNVRGAAIALVVLGHVIQFGSHDRFDYFANPVFASIYAFHMPLFAFISGYLAFRSFGSRAPFVVLADRARRLLVPFFAWGVLGGLSLGLLLQVAGDGRVDPLKLLLRLGEQFVNPGSILWFLLFLFLAYVLASFAIWSERYVKWAAFPLSMVIPFLIPLNSELVMYQVRWLYPFLVAGLLLHRHKRRFVRYERVAVVSAILIFVMLMLMWNRDFSIYVSRDVMVVPGSPAESLGVWAYRYLLASAGVVAATGVVRALSKRFALPGLAALGVASLGIYCVQTYMVLILPRVPAPAPSSVMGFGLYVVFATALILAVAFFLTRFVLERIPILRVALLGGNYRARQRVPVATTQAPDRTS